MGLRFRKSINLGGFRINLSKSGIGYSFGAKGLRYTKKANGGTRTTVSLPGTGLSHVSESGKTKKEEKQSVQACEENRTLDFEITQSTQSEMIDKLNKTKSRSNLFFVLGTILCAFAAFAGIYLIALLAGAVVDGETGAPIDPSSLVPSKIVFAVLFVAALAIGLFLLLRRYTLSLDYDFESAEYEAKFLSLNNGLQSLETNERLYQLTSEDGTAEKIEYNALKFVPKEKYLESQTEIYELKTKDHKILFLPDVMAIYQNNKWLGIAYSQCHVAERKLLVKESTAPSDATFVRQAWKHETKSGEADKRYQDNSLLYECEYAGIYWRSDNGFEMNIIGSNVKATKEFFEKLNEYIEYSKETA